MTKTMAPHLRMFRMIRAALGPLLLLMLAAPLALANIFGNGDPADGIEDDRRLPEPAEAGPLAAVGMIGVPASLGSAALLNIDAFAPARSYDLVISAAHIFFDERGDFTSPDRRYFYYPEGYGGTAIPIVDFAVGSSRPSQNHELDWAVAVLDRRLTPALPALGFANFDEAEIARRLGQGGRFLAAGFATDGLGGFVRQVADGCRPTPEEVSSRYRWLDGVMLHDCDTVLGFSGGPNLLADADGTLYAVAVMSAEALQARAGDRYDPAVNPNLSVRLTGRFLETLLTMAQTGRKP